ncbi:hypothetical protein GCM10010231_33150 [Streptomyces sindenensis]|nr:cation-transporting P-type ATPase [Streptomyces sindenensis]GGP59609.1 hypothetical protein GCM10010231_33150 [Streptomyces sindenensis]
MAGSLAVIPARGPTTADAGRRADARGADELPGPVRRPQWLRLLDRSRSWLIGILLAAAVIAGAVGEVKDTAVITAVPLINATIGHLKERRAERSFEAPRRMLVPTARVRRDGEVQVVPAGSPVCGDIVLPEAGARSRPPSPRLALSMRTGSGSCSVVRDCGAPIRSRTELPLVAGSEGQGRRGGG